MNTTLVTAFMGTTGKVVRESFASLKERFKDNPSFSLAVARVHAGLQAVSRHPNVVPNFQRFVSNKDPVSLEKPGFCPGGQMTGRSFCGFWLDLESDAFEGEAFDSTTMPELGFSRSGDDDLDAVVSAVWNTVKGLLRDGDVQCILHEMEELCSQISKEPSR